MQLIQDWQNILQQHFNKIAEYYSTTADLAYRYEHTRKKRSDIGFNVFTITSDTFYRENFHSDIIKALLDPIEKHQEGNKFLNIFIDLLNDNNPQQYIRKADFQNAAVRREDNDIDISIKDHVSGKAILIENKINNAPDMDRQLPRYYDFISLEFEVVAIVYLTLNTTKYLSHLGWTQQDTKILTPIIYFIPAYDANKVNLHDHWIVPSIIASSNSDSLFLLRQYGNLIMFLNTNSMDTIILEKFYNSLKHNDNLQTSLSIRNMLNDLPEYMAIRIEERYKANCSPFKRIWRYQRRDTVFEAFEMDNLYLKMDIWCSDTGYRVQFWHPQKEEYDIKENLSNIKSLADFTYHSTERNNVLKDFAFDREDALYTFIDELIRELKAFKSNLLTEVPNPAAYDQILKL